MNLRGRGRFLILLLALLALVAGMGGCKKKGPAKGSRQAAAKQVPVNTFDAAARDAEIKPREILTYRPAGKRDPFKSLIKSTEPLKKREGKGLSPLESFDVSGFKLIGIISANRGNFAMLIAPDGKGFTVRKGMHVGLNNGKITRITSNAVEVVEFISNYRGELIPQTTRLELPKEEKR